MTDRDDERSVIVEDARRLIAAYLEGPIASEAWVQHVEYDPEISRWYVRFGCEGRDAATIYFDLHDRTLRYEVYFLPDPPEGQDSPKRQAELCRWLLRRNHETFSVRFSIGPDGDIYLAGRLALEYLSEEELDHVIGEIYELTETWFRTVVKLAYATEPS